MKTISAAAFVFLFTAVSSGCVGSGSWGADTSWPSGNSFATAAKHAATSPDIWVPVAMAGLLIAANVDNKWSEDLADDQPLFGDDAKSTSSDLRDIATGAYIITALLAPSPTIGAKFRGLTVGAATAVADGVMSQGLKELSSRERPDKSNDNSMPSGHVSKAASRTTMARYNIQYIDMPEWSRQLVGVSLHGVAIGTGLARVEARKHHLSDVFVGYALGNFMARLMNEAFMGGHGQDHGTQISFAPVDEGGAFTVTLPLY